MKEVLWTEPSAFGISSLQASSASTMFLELQIVMIYCPNTVKVAPIDTIETKVNIIKL